MTVRRGINILDLLPLTTGLASSIPDGIVEQIGLLNIVDHRSTISPAFYLHEGRLQSLADQFDLNTANWVLSVPGVATGLPFRLAVTRPAVTTTPGAFNTEAAPALWSLDIDVNPVVLVIPWLNAATIVAGDPMKTPSLQAVGGTARQRRVVLQASCVLRISGGGPGGTQVQLMDAPDPFDPNAPSGAVVRADMRPNTAVFGNSQYGMKLDSLVVDLSRQFTPAAIEARGHDEFWTGMSLKELTFFLPVNTPVIDNLTVGVHDLILGSPFGMQGEAVVDFSKDFPDTLNSFVDIEQFDPGGDPDPVPGSQVSTNPYVFNYPVATDSHAERRRVRAKFKLGADLTGVADTKVIGVWWEIPGGTQGNSAITPWFDAPGDAVLRYRLRIVDATLVGQPAAQPSPPSAVPEGQTELQPVTARFPRLAGSPSGAPPIVDARVGASAPYHNTIHVRGPRGAVMGVTLQTRTGIAVRWQLGRGSAPVIVPSSASFSLALLPAGAGPFDLMVTDDNGDPADTQGVRRIRIDLPASGPLVIGHQESASATSEGVVSVDGASEFLQPTLVADTFQSRPYHLTGAHLTAPTPATLNGRKVTIMKGASAEVEVAVPNGANTTPPAVTPTRVTPKAVQILFEYGQAAPVRVASQDEDATAAGPGQDPLRHLPIALPLAMNPGRGGPGGSNIDEQLRAWVDSLPAEAPGGQRRFYVVGRTDDLWYGANATLNASENAALATARMNAVVAKLGLVVPPAKIVSRIETGSAAGWPTVEQGAPARMLSEQRLALPPGNDPLGQSYAQSGAGGKPVWRRQWREDAIDNNAANSQHARARADHDRVGYRCAEIFAIDINAPADNPGTDLGGAASRVSMLVPGEDGEIANLVVSSPKDARMDWRMRLKARWDSPSVSTPADGIPTLAEAMLRLKSTDIVLPAVDGNAAPNVASTQPTGPQYWEVLLNWAFDATTGQTEATGSLSIPHGKLQLISDIWAGAFAFGPALAAKLDEGDVTGSEVGDFIGGIACIAAGAAIGAFLNKDAVAGDHRGSVIIDKFTLGYKWNGAPQAAATVDYTVDLRVKTGITGVFTVTGHLKLAYKNVGVIFQGASSGSGGGLQDLSFNMRDLAVQVVDPGTWSLGGPLGNLIRVASSRMGNGSEWMEFDLEFAIDLGVVRLEGATIRMRFASDPGQSAVELRGLTAVVEVPQTLTGRGSATIGDGGAFRAMLGLEVIPAKLAAYGAIAVDQDFVSIEVGIQLPVGIPLGGTGFGLFGFVGRFVANGTRDLSKCTAEDPVDKQLQWYALPPIDKYKRLSGQYAFGVGAVVGTLPDGGYSFNAEGALTLGFPDISVIFSIDAHLVQQRRLQAVSQGESTAATTRILGMVVIESDAVMIAVRTTYKIPNLLELKIPMSAYFPTDTSKAWYIRIGTDNGPGRSGEPISLTLFPDVLDVRAWAFIMFEERQLHDLGGTLIPSWANVPSLDFEGFSVGLGAGFDLRWEAGPFSLSISAFLVLGLGTKPLLCAGAAGVAGSLDLVVVTLDVNGTLYFIVGEKHDPYAEGHFCASIDCWLFEIEGCVDITIGSKPVNPIEKPASPIAGLDLCDHFAIVKGKADAGGTTVPVVWPNTVGVLKFAHYMDDVASSPTGFVRKLTSPAPLSIWSGSNQLKYAFRLTRIELFKENGGVWEPVAGPFDSVWWLPTHRKAKIEAAPAGIPPSTEEGRELGLWTIDPAPWAKWLTPESLSVPGSPTNTYGTLCDPVAELTPACARGRDRAHAPNAFGSFKAKAPAGSVYPGSFLAVARLDSKHKLGEVVALAGAAGFNYVPGAVVPLAAPFSHDGMVLERGWRFPAFRKHGMIVGTTPMSFDVSKALMEGALYLQVCRERRGGTTLPTPPTRICDSMPREDGTIDSFTGESGAHYRGKLRCMGLDGERLISLSEPMEAVRQDEVGEVSIWVDPREGIVLLSAMDRAGTVLGQARNGEQGRQWLTVTAPGIVRIRVEPIQVKRIGLFSACWGQGGDKDQGQACDRMPERDGKIGSFIGVSGAVYEGSLVCAAVGGERAVVLEEIAFGQRRSPVGEVALDVDPREGSAILVAYDSAGNIITRVPTNGPGRQWVTIRAAGIVRIGIDPQGDRSIVYTVCWGGRWPDRPPSLEEMLDVQKLAQPKVVAVDEEGKEQVLEGAVTGQDSDRQCRVLAYKLPQRAPGKAWVRIRVAAWSRGDVALVALCGVTVDAVIAQGKDKQFSDTLIDLLEEQTQAVKDNQPTQNTYLDANSKYKLRVTWQWAGWVPPTPDADPPAVPAEWKPEEIDEFRFDTAAFGVTAPGSLPSAKDTTLDMDPAQGGPGYDERTFDPRGLSRFIAHTYPTHEDPPHFLDDQVGFWFTANHLQSLVAKYGGRELKCKVYHTRPKAGSLKDYAGHLPGSRHVLDKTLDDPILPGYVAGNPKWELTTDAWTVSDAAIATVLEALPCVDLAPGSGASMVTVKADLEPNSEYDLLLNTVKPGDATVEEVVVARSHFRTSRYRQPEGLLRALGFGPTVGGETPNDVITTYDMATHYGPAVALAVGDAALDTALTRLGMDPWPLPPAPRTTVIWRATGNAAFPWQIGAILLEADEPVWRAGMRTGALNEPAPPPRVEVRTLEVYRNWDKEEPQGDGTIEFVPQRTRVGDAMREVVRNSAGTRVLFAAGAAAVAPGTQGGLFEVQLWFNEKGAPGAIGVAAIFSGPAIVAQEL